MERYVLVDHTADMMVKAFGSTLEECFANAAYALFDQTVDLSNVAMPEETEVRVSGIDDEDRLFSFLSELLYIEDAENLVLKEFDVSFEGDDVVCRARGERLDLSRHRIRSEVKAVTYHMMEVDRETPSVTVLFDVRCLDDNKIIEEDGQSPSIMLRLGWFSTGRGPGSRNLLKSVMDRKLAGELDIEISFVFCNWSNEEAENPRREQRRIFFDMVEGYGIPLVTVSWKEFMPGLRSSDEAAWRVEYGKALRDAVSPYPFDLGILAGYMLWMDDATCEAFDMLNLHPALPDGPKGTWQEVIWQLIEQRADRQGAMMHVCTEEWDRGAAISYCGFPIRGSGYDELWEDLDRRLESSSIEDVKRDMYTDLPLFRRIREDGAKRELPLICETISAFADGRLRIEGKKPVAGGRVLDGAYDLTGLVDRCLEAQRCRASTTQRRSSACSRTGSSSPISADS